jgi:hypothetical protein
VNQIMKAVFKRMALLILAGVLAACQSAPPMRGVGMTGIDHLADHLSVQDFQVDGHSAFQAGKGGSSVCCTRIPETWHPGLKVHVTWNVTNWRDRTWSEQAANVEVDRYDEIGDMYVHFLPDGSVRVVLSNYPPRADAYPGPKGIPQKYPWDRYPWPSSEDETSAKPSTQQIKR